MSGRVVRVPLIFFRALAYLLIASVFLGALASFTILPRRLPLGTLVSFTASGAASLFAVGLPFCCLAVALIVSRRGGRAGDVVATGLLATLLASCLILLLLAGGSSLVSLASLLGGGALGARESLQFHTTFALSVLPFSLTILGLLIVRSPIMGGAQPHPMQIIVAVGIALLVAASIVAQNSLFGDLPSALIGWAPSLIATAAIGVFAFPFLFRA